MEIRCLEGHFLAELQEGDTFTLRMPCDRCKRSYVFRMADRRLMIGLLDAPRPGGLKRTPLPRREPER